MALEGFTGRAIGNNPLAFAMPVPGGAPLVFDMAMSKVARGNVAAAVREGRDIPEGWAVDPQGRPTTDAKAALAGAMLPLGDHKGLGLAMLVQCFAGSLAGATAQARVLTSSAGSLGAFLLVVNPDLLAGRAAYEANVREWLGAYRAAGGSAARYPGERQAQSEAQRLRDGIPVNDALLQELRAIGARLGVDGL
jgi:LDH2 family malate/lactate/ureidoglycolate dehydrogenase